MVHDLWVSPETAPPSFEKGNLCLTIHSRGLPRSLFLFEKGLFVFISHTFNKSPSRYA